MSESHEFVVFRFVAGMDADAEAGSMRALGAILATLPGFVRRSCYRANDGLWVDHVVWADRAAAEASTSLALADPAAAAIFARMEQNGLVFAHTSRVLG